MASDAASAEAAAAAATPPAAPAPAATDAAAAASSDIIITVSDPVKLGEGMHAYISYKINTKTDDAAFDYNSFSVVRRYSDFVWLHQQLVRNYAGVVIPPLPEKLIVGRFSPEFVESRRRALEKFLNRVACHADLRASAHFKAFLESSEDGLAATKATTKEEQRARKKSKGWGQWFSEKAQAVSSKVGRSSSVAKTPEDVQFDEVVQYVEALEPQVGNVHKHTQGLVRRSRDLANGLFEFGLAFTLLGQSEQGVLENALTEVGHTADKLSVLAAEQAEKEALYFEEPIKDYIRIIGAVKNALSTRNAKRLTYETATNDLRKAQAAHDALVGKPGKEEAVHAKEQEVKTRQGKVDTTKADFETVQQKVMSEIGRFKEEKLADFKTIVLDYVQLQIEYNQKVEEMWKELMPTLNAIDADAPLGAAAEGGGAGGGGGGGGEEE